MSEKFTEIPLSDRDRTFSRRTFLKAMAGAAIAATPLARAAETFAANNLEYAGDPNVQIEDVERKIREIKRLSPSTLHEIQNEIGTRVKLQLGTFPAPVLQASSELTPRYSLVKEDDTNKYFPNMCIDNYPVTEHGGSQLQMQGIYLGRVTRPIETSIGTTYADIGFTYRWLGGDNEDSMTKIIEPSWLAWRKADNSVSSFAVIMNYEGNFPYPQDHSTATPSNGATLVEQLDIGKDEIKAIDIVTGHPLEAVDWSTEAAAQGWPGEFYTYEAVQAMIDASQKHYDIYELATLTQAEEDEYVIKYIDEIPNPPPTDITQATPEVIERNISKTLKELPNYKDYLSSEPITIEQLLPLVRVHAAAISPIKI
jgi:hypothetical protein